MSSDELQDGELISRVAAGDADAFAQLFRRRQGQVYRFALHMTASPSIAEDVTQEVFLAVMRDAGRYDGARASVIAWLCGIARNHVRRRAERDRLLQPFADGEDSDTDSDGLDEILAVEPDTLGDSDPRRECRGAPRGGPDAAGQVSGSRRPLRSAGDDLRGCRHGDRVRRRNGSFPPAPRAGAAGREADGECEMSSAATRWAVPSRQRSCRASLGPPTGRSGA